MVHILVPALPILEMCKNVRSCLFRSCVVFVFNQNTLSCCSYVVNKHISINGIKICHFYPSQKWTFLDKHLVWIVCSHFSNFFSADVKCRDTPNMWSCPTGATLCRKSRGVVHMLCPDTPMPLPPKIKFVIRYITPWMCNLTTAISCCTY